MMTYLVTILVFMELALQYLYFFEIVVHILVTILVFMELALQLEPSASSEPEPISHNPCFYGISFAIK